MTPSVTCTASSPPPLPGTPSASRTRPRRPSAACGRPGRRSSRGQLQDTDLARQTREAMLARPIGGIPRPRARGLRGAAAAPDRGQAGAHCPARQGQPQSAARWQPPGPPPARAPPSGIAAPAAACGRPHAGNMPGPGDAPPGPAAVVEFAPACWALALPPPGSALTPALARAAAAGLAAGCPGPPPGLLAVARAGQIDERLGRAVLIACRGHAVIYCPAPEITALAAAALAALGSRAALAWPGPCPAGCPCPDSPRRAPEPARLPAPRLRQRPPGITAHVCET